MVKVIRCRGIGMVCDFVARAETEQEVLDMCVDHIRMAHGIQELPPDLAEKIRAAIHEEAGRKTAGV